MTQKYSTILERIYNCTEDNNMSHHKLHICITIKPMCSIIFKPIFYITLHLICFTRLSIIIKEKTYCSGHIQRSCTSSSAIRLTNECMWDPRVRARPLPPPPHPPQPRSLCSFLRGSERPGRGGIASGHLPIHALWQWFPTALIHHDLTRQLS
jgi:hypothetical protein